MYSKKIYSKYLPHNNTICRHCIPHGYCIKCNRLVAARRRAIVKIYKEMKELKDKTNLLIFGE